MFSGRVLKWEKLLQFKNASLLKYKLLKGLSTGQCYLYYSWAVCTVLLIKYQIINLVHHLRPFTKIINVQALWETNRVLKKLLKGLVTNLFKLPMVERFVVATPLPLRWYCLWAKQLPLLLLPSAPLYSKGSHTQPEITHPSLPLSFPLFYISLSFTLSLSPPYHWHPSAYSPPAIFSCWWRQFNRSQNNFFWCKTFEI